MRISCIAGEIFFLASVLDSLLVLRARLVACISIGQALQMHVRVVWFPGQPLEPGSARAAVLLEPGPLETHESSVSCEPGSADAAQGSHSKD